MTRLGTWILGCAAVIVTIAAVPASAGAAVQGTNGAAVPELNWGPCGIEGREAYQCATAEVPLSYRDPEGPSIELALGKLPATDPERKLGTLFWNPGGPGGSGRFPPVVSPALNERFDIVGFDPRGTHASTPVRCFASNEEAIELFGAEFPVTEAQERDYLRRTARGAELCARNGGPLLSHMSTANVARDLELLRRAIGDAQLTYFGRSYGTHIGAVYANLFPDRVRALALDAVLDPIEWTTGREPRDAFVPVTFRIGSHVTTSQALHAFLRACAADARCAFREEGVDLRRKFETLLSRLREQPLSIPLPDGSVDLITYQRAVTFTTRSLYRASDSPVLAATLQQWYEATGARAVHVAAQRPSARAQEPYAGFEWTPAVMCSETANPSNPLVWPLFGRAADRFAPHFGRYWLYVIPPCAFWPARDPDRYTGPWDRDTANPILLIGNSGGDPATPYEDAQSTARELANARVLTLNSFGHVAQTRGRSRCIDAAVDRYLIDLELPAEGTVCQPDLGPFDTPPAATRERQASETQTDLRPFQP